MLISFFSTLPRKQLRMFSKRHSASITDSEDYWDRRDTAEECKPNPPKVALCLVLPVPPDDCSRFLSAEEFEWWQPGRFRYERPLQPATRNKGQVHWMFDAARGVDVAVKVMPNEWVCTSHADFLNRHPASTEQPWVDVGCTAFLNSVAFPYACPLLGVFRDEEATRVVTELAPGGDLFGWSSACAEAPGAAREAAWLPVASQVLDAVRCLHDLSIVHRDISMRNILVTQRAPNGTLHVQLVDFGMATTRRFAQHTGPSTPAYQAPELHAGGAVDGFMSDAFAAGVVLYGLFMTEYPWTATQRGRCEAFDFASNRGMHELIDHRLRQLGMPAQRPSEPLVQLLAGLLAIDPAERLTLGESSWLKGKKRRSVWEQPALSEHGPSKVQLCACCHAGP